MEEGTQWDKKARICHGRWDKMAIVCYERGDKIGYDGKKLPWKRG